MIGTGSAPVAGSLRSAAPPVVLQTADAEGGSALVVGLVLAALLLAAVLSVAIAYRLYVGYRGSGDRSMLAIAVGLLLLTTVPTIVRIVVPTVLGGAATVRIFATTVSELSGLLAILYAVRRPARTRRRVDRQHASVAFPLVIGTGSVLDHLGIVAQAITPIVGSYVAWLAYRGYRRNDSAPMAFLAMGIVLLTVLPYVAVVVGPSLGATDAGILLVVSLSQLSGLVSVYYSLTRA